MRRALVMLLAAGIAGTMRAEAQGTGAGARTPVLVELFTSEGCSSCPPADALLKRLAREQPLAGVEILVMGEHVDYWDHLGWTDRFSSAQFTQRQNGYARRLRVDEPYTPQMIVDGGDQFVGSDRARALRSIAEAGRKVKVPMTISQPRIEGGAVGAEVSLAGADTLKIERGDEMFVALVQPEATTEVKGGENGGRRLEHVGVVRAMERVGELEGMKRGPVRVSLRVPVGMDAAGGRLVVFAAHRDEGMVVGAASRPVVEGATAERVGSR